MAKRNHQQRNLEKHKNGYWYFVKTFKKERIKESLSTKDINEARQLRDNYNAHLKLYGILPTNAKNAYEEPIPSFHEVCEEWYKAKINTCEVTTLESYRDVLNYYFFKVPFINKPINEIKKKEINRWWRKLRLKTDTVNKNLTYMSNIFDFAIDEEWTEINPLKNIRRPKSKGSNIDPFELEQVEVILCRRKRKKFL